MVFVGVAGCSSAPLASHVQHGSGLACRLRELGVYICIYIYMYVCIYLFIFGSLIAFGTLGLQYYLSPLRALALCVFWSRS